MDTPEQIRSRIQADMKSAMKEGKALTVSTLRLLLGQFTLKEKEKQYHASDSDKESALSVQDMHAMIGSEIKKRNDAIAEFEKGGRTDLAEKEREEAKILESYLPPQMGDEELRQLVQDAIASSGAKERKDMGKVMAILMPKVQGKAQGSRVTALVQELLSQ